MHPIATTARLGRTLALLLLLAAFTSGSAAWAQQTVDISKTCVSPVKLGDTTTCTITVTNTDGGGGESVQFTVSDDVPALVDVLSASGPGTSSVTDQRVDWSVIVPNNDSRSLTITVEGFTRGSATNTAAIDAAVSTTTPSAIITYTNSSSSTGIQVTAADLSITKDVSNNTPNDGEVITFTVTVTNDGDATNDVVVQDVLTDNDNTFNLQSANYAAGDTYVNGTWTFDLGGGGATRTLELVGEVGGTGEDFTNEATITSSGDQPDLSSGNDGPVAADVDPNQLDVAVGKSVVVSNPATSEFTITLTAENLSGTITATNVVIEDILGPDVTFQSTTDLDYNPGTGEWSISSIAPGGVATVDIVVICTSPSPVTNTATLMSVDQFDTNAANDSASDTLDKADLSIAKTVSDATPDEGQAITFTVTLRNDGINTTGVVVQDVVTDAGGSFTYNPAADVSVSTGTWDAGTGEWTLDIGGGTEETLTITGTVDGPDPFDNAATITDVGALPDNDTADNSASVTVTPNLVDLAVTKTMAVTNPVAQQVTFTLTATNNGPADATGIVVDDALDADLTFVSASGDGVYDDGAGTWTLAGPIASGNAATIDIVVTDASAPDANNQNQATLSAVDQFETDAGNDASATVEIDQADIIVTKAIDLLEGYTGDVLEVTLTATNDGPDDATGVEITDALPAEMTYVAASASATDGTATESANTITWTLDLTDGQSETLTFYVIITATEDGTVTNTAALTAASAVDPVPADASASESIQAYAGVPLRADAEATAGAFWTDPESGLTYPLVGAWGFGFYRSVPDAYNSGLPDNRIYGRPLSGLPNPLYIQDIFVTSSNRVLVATWGNKGLYASDDGGRTFSAVDFPVLGATTGSDGAIVYAIEEAVDGTLYASADRGRIFSSADGGATWDLVGELPRSSADTPWSLATHPTDAATIYAGTFGFGMYVTTDGGLEWNLADGTGLTNGYFFDLEFEPGAGTPTLWGATARGIYRTTDDGATWTDESSGLEVPGGSDYWEVRHIAFDENATPDQMWVSTWGGGVYERTAPFAVDTWDGVTLRGVRVNFAEPGLEGNILLVGTQGYGMYYVDPATATDVEEPAAEVPTEYALDQNYPNPFNPVTTIRFALPESGPARVAVYDLLGREVAVLVDGALSAGTHEVTFDAADLPSGTYLYRLETATNTEHRTMTLIK